MGNVLRHYSLTASTTAAALELPVGVQAIILRTPSTNSGSIYVQLDEAPANSTYGTPLAAGENIVVDIGNALIAYEQKGLTITNDKFIRTLAYVGSAAGQILNVEVLTWV